MPEGHYFDQVSVLILEFIMFKNPKSKKKGHYFDKVSVLYSRIQNALSAKEHKDKEKEKLKTYITYRPTVSGNEFLELGRRS